MTNLTPRWTLSLSRWCSSPNNAAPITTAGPVGPPAQSRAKRSRFLSFDFGSGIGPRSARMTSMTDLSVIVTGIVGVAGMGSTILASRMTARSQTANLRITLEAETKRITRDERRQVYSRCITALEAMSDAASNLRVERFHGGNEPSDKAKELEAHSSFIAAAEAAKLVIAEVSLVGPDNVRSLSSDYFMTIVEDTKHDVDNEAALPHVKMVAAMQAALDAPSESQGLLRPSA
jgi:hypothetical protein